MAPAALDTLNELAAALGDDENFASNLVTTLGNISGSLSSDLSAASGVLDTRITTEVSGLNSSLVTASGLLDTRLVDIESNFLDKRVGGIISGNLEINGGGAGSASLFVGSGVVGINTETPSEALDVVGNGKFSGTVEVAAPSAANHASTKGYVDDLFAKQKSFSTPVTQNVESMSVTFPGSAFYSAPIVNVTMEGSVSYAFMISNRTTTGFDISFSDEVLENDIVLNVFATNQ